MNLYRHHMNAQFIAPAQSRTLLCVYGLCQNLFNPGDDLTILS